jgi:hypothetical protein
LHGRWKFRDGCPEVDTKTVTLLSSNNTLSWTPDQDYVLTGCIISGFVVLNKQPGVTAGTLMGAGQVTEEFQISCFDIQTGVRSQQNITNLSYTLLKGEKVFLADTGGGGFCTMFLVPISADIPVNG